MTKLCACHSSRHHVDFEVVICSENLPLVFTNDLALPSTRLKPTDFDVSIPDFIMMMLQADVADFLFGKARHPAEFAFGNELRQFRTAQFVFHHLESIKPVLHVIMVNNQTRLVPIANG